MTLDAEPSLEDASLEPKKVRLSGEPYAGNEAGTQVDHPSIDSRYVRVRVEHEHSIANKRRIGGLVPAKKSRPPEAACPLSAVIRRFGVST